VSHVDPEVLALRALGERAGTDADDAHLPGCAHCQAELDKFAEVVTVARQDEHADQLLRPPAEVWSGITQELGPEANLGVQPGPGPGPAPSPGPDLGLSSQPGPAQPGSHDGGPVRRRPAGHASGGRIPWWRRPVAVAAAFLLIGFGVAAGVRELASSPGSSVVANITLRPLPQFPQWKGATGTAVMEQAASGRLLSVTLQAPARRGFYEVWLLARDGVKMISLGDLNSDHTGLFAMPQGVDLADYSRIDVSLQPFNGSTLHSRDSVVRGSLP
jgi:Anti-sigma-K factor rskA